MENIKEKLIHILKIIFFIVQIFLFIWLFKYLGIKGLVGLVIGFAIMAYLIFSKNQSFIFFVRLINGDINVEKMFK